MTRSKNKIEVYFAALPFFLTLAACNPRLKFTNTDPSNGPAQHEMLADNFDNSPPDEDYSDLDEAIADLENTSFSPVKEPATSITIEEVKKEVVEPKNTDLETELEKELATFQEEPEEVKTIDIDEINALSKPNRPPSLPKPKLKKYLKPQAGENQNREPEIAELNSETELFEQKESKVDILFVVDNSPSMMREQARLGERLQAFLKGIRHMDWQIAFTTSDVSNGKYGIKGSLLDLYNHPNQKVLKSDFPDAEEVFYNTVKRSESKNCIFGCPSSNEQPLRASILAMEKRSSENANFFREDADLSIVILSDEDEMSTGSNKATKPQAVIDSFHSNFGNNKKLSVYGIIIQPNDSVCYQDQKSEGLSNAHPGEYITELSQRTDGYTGSICDQDYAVSLEKISEQTRLIADSFKLKRTPIVNSVKVKLIPDQNVEWKVERDSLMFISPPKEGTQVQISYNYVL